MHDYGPFGGLFYSIPCHTACLRQPSRQRIRVYAAFGGDLRGGRCRRRGECTPLVGEGDRGPGPLSFGKMLAREARAKAKDIRPRALAPSASFAHEKGPANDDGALTCEGGAHVTRGKSCPGLLPSA